uniref:Conserved hypothetical plastid protein n=1 Tax=Caulacanthus okamurae TaxID=152008 RepID=A0A6H1U7U6_9FLOR|nr:conserved hypothetical plastid protein [Caulacanthus okamurae]QIZ74735.1 conserved hypothetical plastid protein [Caulacanthus okamurae]
MIFQNYFTNISQPNLITHLHINNKKLNKDKNFPAMVNYPLSNNKRSVIEKNNVLADEIEKTANKVLISPNFIIRLLNNYWQETIFLSKSNSVSETYINQLRSDGIIIHKNQYKKFLSEFSKALTINRIKSSLNAGESYLSANEVKYVWKKGFNFSLPKNLLRSIVNRKTNKELINKQAKLLKKLNKQKFPVFTIVNNCNQILVAEPPEKLANNYNLIDRLYKCYSIYFGESQNIRPIYQSLFFLNPQDAVEYKIYIESQYKSVSPNSHFYLMTTELNDYYQLAISLKHKVQFCLIPDLKELGQLMYDYQHNQNLSFHTAQKYGQYAFQGQPIYFIKPTVAKNKQTNKLTNVYYRFQDQTEHTDVIFMNYNTALLAWKKFVHSNHNYKLPTNPQILVYNLEDYLNTCLSSLKDQTNNFLFVPSKESYVFLKSRLLLKPNNSIHRIIVNNLTAFRLFANKIVWSLTSKHPIN